MELYEALKVDSPIIRLLLTKVDHIQPLQLTPPISLSHLEDKLRIIDHAIDDVRSQISPIYDIAVAQLCRPVQSSIGDTNFENAFKDQAIDLGEADKSEWAVWIKTWNEGIEMGLNKVDILDWDCCMVDAAWYSVTRSSRWGRRTVWLRY